MEVQVTVVGAGVIGLVTALTLEERGLDVRVVATSTGATTTSAIAGAVWFPYQVGPPDKVPVWAARTAAWLTGLAADRDTGIDILTGYEIDDDHAPRAGAGHHQAPGAGAGHPAVPWWAAATPVERVPAPVTGAPLAWRFTAPRAEPAQLLPWLAARLRHPIEHRTVVALADEPGDVVVDCTGLAARELAPDPAVVPLFGQIVIAAPGGVDLSVTVTDDRVPDEIFYCIPRRAELVLGGCSRPWPPGAPPVIDPALTARILRQAAALGLPIGDVITVRTGLRPFRPAVRLAREGRIVHNYGHGGAGFTLCRGCAEDVGELIRT